MNTTNEITNIKEIQSIDISLKQIPFLSIESNLSVNALYKILIKNPDLINMINEKQETFLSYAIKRNNNPIIDLILTSPLLDLTYQDKNGNTYLHLSIIQQNLKLIKNLLEKKISINTKNNDGNTALHLAYYINNNEIIKLLLINNADNNIKNNNGFIAEEVIPTNDIDKIAGYEVDMNLSINDELKYLQNNINEDKKYNLCLNTNTNESINNKKNKNSKNNIKSKEKEKQENKTKINQSKNNNKNIYNNHNKTKDYKNNKNKIINNKIINNKSNTIKNNVKNNINKKYIDKNDDNEKINKSNNKNDNINISKNKIKDEEYKDLGNAPFHFGKTNRKISNIDKIYNENDKFIRRESECYAFYTELINSNNDSLHYSIKKNSTKNKNKNNNNNLSNIIENNNKSENSFDNIAFDKEIKKNNSSQYMSNGERLNNSSKNNNSSILNNSVKKNNNILLYNSSKDMLSNNSKNSNSNSNSKRNSNRNSNSNITMIQNIMINCSNKPLLDFLMQINLQKYYYNFNNNGFDNIYMIIENAKKGRHITDNQLKKIGIIKAGDRAKLLIRIQEKANLFEFNVPRTVYYTCYHLEKIEDDKTVYKLYEWLKNIKLEEYLNYFLNNGYFSVDLLLVQLLSNNPLTDEILKNDIGIDKLGYRTRILNKLKEEYNSYSKKLKDSVVQFHAVENTKICSECVMC